ncbi:alpha/beta fold hydrolase [Acinetobacter sp. ANC 5380]|uniref:Alpha/beta fold hydrolase n=1 Tax=Acinetobacter terrae TaxID=2731247 RepID=A0A241VIS5_9GAMM|nr:alpha/beta fold hydrolase [Acinetobacter terrae]NNH39485.1 alpha/beta fold hydrolase [Acinetobacter terrae]NNH76345.1 alpha/beta fold hydrolase [Acinetobacter terrae]OTG77580.1 triacylglycerol lipase [Acinetobacter terrae]
MNKTLLTVLMSSSVFLLTACGSGDGESIFNGPNNGIPVNNIQNPVVNVTAYTKDGMPEVAADSQLMTYKMLGVDNKEVTATTLVFVPKTVQPANGWPIVVWAHGTTGVADKCAPSQQGLLGTEGLLQKLLAEGYVVVAPDYEGLGSPGNHPFLNLKSEAFSITDAVVATRDYLNRQGKKAAPQWVAIGHSQGGHAALGAAQYASRAKLDYKGTIAIAPPSNLAAILQGGENAVKDQPANIQIPVLASLDTFTSLIVAGMQRHKISVSYAEVFKADTAKIAPIAETECSGPVGAALAKGMTDYVSLPEHLGSLNGYGRNQDNFMSIPVIQNFLVKDSQPGTVKLSQPVIIYQGGKDPTVPQAATDLLKASAEAKGTKIQYITNANWDHTTVYTSNSNSFVANVKTLFAQ